MAATNATTLFLAPRQVRPAVDLLRPYQETSVDLATHKYNHFNPCIEYDQACRDIDRAYIVCEARCIKNETDIQADDIPNAMCDCENPTSYLSKTNKIWFEAVQAGFIIRL